MTPAKVIPFMFQEGWLETVKHYDRIWRTFVCAFCLKNIQSSELDDQSPRALVVRGDVVVAASCAGDPPSNCYNVVDIKIGCLSQCGRY